MLDVFFHPFELLAAQRAESTSLQVQHVHQPDEVHAFLIKAVPSRPLGALSIPFEVGLPVIVQHVVFAGYKEYVLRARAFQNLIDGVELFWSREVADVARVQQKLWLVWQPIDLVHSRLQCSYHIRIGRLNESHLASTDLRKPEVAA